VAQAVIRGALTGAGHYQPGRHAGVPPVRLPGRVQFPHRARRHQGADHLAAGPLAARHTRKTLLVAGWAAGLPVPFLLAYAPSWGWIVAANMLLGVNQGLTWSMTVNMKIDLVRPRGRGLATA
jgi:MFS family permease